MSDRDSSFLLWIGFGVGLGRFLAQDPALTVRCAAGNGETQFIKLGQL